jgi:hypothetical protein
MKVGIILLLVLAFTCFSARADEEQDIKDLVHDLSQMFRIKWDAFQASVHLAEHWNVPETCLGDQFEKHGFEIIKSIITVIEESKPIQAIITVVSEGYKALKIIREDCLVNDNIEELRLYCKVSDCSISALTKRAYAHITQIRELAEEISHQRGSTDENYRIIGRNYGKIVAIILGLSEVTPKNLLKEQLSA